MISLDVKKVSPAVISRPQRRRWLGWMRRRSGLEWFLSPVTAPVACAEGVSHADGEAGQLPVIGDLVIDNMRVFNFETLSEGLACWNVETREVEFWCQGMVKGETFDDGAIIGLVVNSDADTCHYVPG